MLKMVIRSQENVFGAWAYTIGVVLAVIIGIVVGLDVPNINDYKIYASGILVILGLIIGFLNVGSKDMNTFLIAGVSLVIVNSFALDAVSKGILTIGAVGELLGSVFNSLLLLFVPATILVALKLLFSISKV
jgi:hypothetical protein